MRGELPVLPSRDLLFLSTLFGPDFFCPNLAPHPTQPFPLRTILLKRVPFVRPLYCALYLYLYLYLLSLISPRLRSAHSSGYAANLSLRSLAPLAGSSL